MKNNHSKPFEISNKTGEILFQHDQVGQPIRFVIPSLLFEIKEGEKLGNGFFIDQLYTSYEGGEAVYYSCSKDDGKKYVVKIYFNKDLRQELVHELISSVTSPYVRKLVAYGKYLDQYPYEVYQQLYTPILEVIDTMPVSLIETHIIPQLNEAIHSLHQLGLAHHDIKSSNIFFENNKDLILADFGQSEVFKIKNSQCIRQSPKRLRLFTFGFTAPELKKIDYNDTYLYPQSDYYSLGVTIEDLYRKGEMSISLRKVNAHLDLNKEGLLSNTIPNHVKDLIFKLKEPNPEKRIGYKEVKVWIENHYIFNEVYKKNTEALEIPLLKPYTFNHHDYHDLKDVVSALFEHISKAKDEIYTEKFKALFKVLTEEKQELLQKAYQYFDKTNQFQLLLDAIERVISPKSPLRWRGKTFATYQDFLIHLIDNFEKQKFTDDDFYNVYLFIHLHIEDEVLLRYINQLHHHPKPLHQFSFLIAFLNQKFILLWEGQRYQSIVEFLRSLYKDSFLVSPLSSVDEEHMMHLFKYKKPEIYEDTWASIVSIKNQDERYMELIFLLQTETDSFFFEVEKEKMKNINEMIKFLTLLDNPNDPFSPLFNKIYEYMNHPSFIYFARQFKDKKITDFLHQIKHRLNTEEVEFTKAYLAFYTNPEAPLTIGKDRFQTPDQWIQFLNQLGIKKGYGAVVAMLKQSVVKAYLDAHGFSIKVLH
jgi:serine/threonine protein kinase